VSMVLWLIFGCMAGWLATILMGEHARVGLRGNLLFGSIGAVGGGMASTLLGLGSMAVFSWWGLVVAVGGACLCIFLVQVIRGRA